MRVLLVSSFVFPGGSVSPMLGLYRLSHHLAKHGIDCDIVDLAIDKVEEVFDKIEKGFYEIIGLSVSDTYIVKDIEFLSKAQEKGNGQDILFVAGGVTATSNYKQILDIGFDVVVLGYGENALLELCKMKQAKRFVLESVQGVAWKKNDTYRCTELQKMSFAVFKHFNFDNELEMNIPYKKYWDITRQEKEKFSTNKTDFIVETVRLYTSAFCPGKCGYCSAKILRLAHGKNQPEFFLPSEMVMELVHHVVQKYGAKLILFNDDDFFGIPKRSIDFLENIIKEKASGKLPSDLTFFGQMRVMDALDSNKKPHRALLRLMEQSGFNRVALGVESFSSRLLSTPMMHKKGYNAEIIESLIDAMVEHSICPQINIMLGVPETSENEVVYDLQKALECIDKGCTVTIIPHILAFSGAPVYSHEMYPTSTRKLYNTTLSKSIVLKKSFLIHDKNVQEKFDLYDDLYEKTLKKFIQKNSLGNRIHRQYLSLIAILVLSKLFEAKDIFKKVSNMIDKQRLLQ